MFQRFTSAPIRVMLSIFFVLGAVSPLVQPTAAHSSATARSAGPAQPSSAIQTPAEFLGYELGERFTYSHLVRGYFTHVAERSDRVTLQTYGETYQGQPLVLVTVTSPQNHASLEEIRTNNLKLTGLMEGAPTANRKAILWMSYNVHGNEASSSEAAMQTLYELATRTDAEVTSILATTVILMDPVLNPDGRDRYVSGVTQRTGRTPNPHHSAQEHQENWPGGRSNHYLFDLNRDWAWMVQKESQARIAAYQRWMPHVHVDFHEMGYQAPYFFAPAAAPYHPVITDWQKQFQQTIGSYNMEAFDREGWIYFTREVFDLYYPSYGDTWPTYNGSVGMTYEQAGGGFAGLSVRKPEGDNLTLKDRLTHHHVAGLATAKAVSDNADKVVRAFEAYFADSRTRPAGTWHSFIVKGDQNPDRIHALLSQLDRHNIRYSRVSQARSATGFDFSTGREGRVSIASGDILITTSQPKGQLARVFFEPAPTVPDSLTYDITAWEAHYRYGLSGFALREKLSSGAALTSADLAPSFRVVPADGGPAVRTAVNVDRPYAYLLRWESLADARFLADWLEAGGLARVSEKPFQIGAQRFAAGTLVITREGNPALRDTFDATIREIAEAHARTLYAASSGAVSSGSDLGSSSMRLVKAPAVAMVSQQGTSSLSAGEVWHFFDQQVGYPVTLIPAEGLGTRSLKDFDVLVMPSGYYSTIRGNAWQEITDWVRRGGRLVAIEDANRVLARQDAFGIKVKDGESDEDGGAAGARSASTSSGSLPGDNTHAYGDSERRGISDSNAGAIFRATLDPTHPLAFGYGPQATILNTTSTAYEYLGSGWTVASFPKGSLTSGFVGSEALPRLEESLYAGVESMGSGSAVYFPVNPLFRGFWENTKLLFANAVFLPVE